MEHIELTLTERAILSNQNRMLAALYPEQANHYNHLAEIAEEGYPYFYEELLSNVSEEFPLEVCEETFNILNMYRSINNGIARLTEEQKVELNLPSLNFEGFDGNNDKHYFFMNFAVEKCDKFHEYKGMSMNSHTPTSIFKYRNMLKVFKAAGESSRYAVTFEDLLSLCESV